MRVLGHHRLVFQDNSMPVLKNLTYIFKAIGYSYQDSHYGGNHITFIPKEKKENITLEASSAVTSPLIFFYQIQRLCSQYNNIGNRFWSLQFSILLVKNIVSCIIASCQKSIVMANHSYSRYMEQLKYFRRRGQRIYGVSLPW